MKKSKKENPVKVHIVVYNSYGCEIDNCFYEGVTAWECLKKFNDDYLAEAGDVIKIESIEGEE